MDNRHCRFCGQELHHTFVNLGLSPLANEYLRESDLDKGQTFYPLNVSVCEKCLLVQTALYQQPKQIFGEYQYFSSYSTSWLKHCSAYVDMIIPRLGLGTDSKVLEIACNDGYLLQYFSPYHISAKGVEPAENVAQVARDKGIDVDCCFFNEESAQRIVGRDGTYDLVIGNNVLAHVPDISGFVKGLSIVLSENGTITMEFPHLLRLMQECQFDTIYHEHFYYLSLMAVRTILKKHDLTVYDVEELPTHGGSLRIYAGHASYASELVSASVLKLLSKERAFGLDGMDSYSGFSKRVKEIKYSTVNQLYQWKKMGKRIAAFGAAAKGNTFLNYCGIDVDVIDFVVDSNPHKQGLYLPGTLIPIMDELALREQKPDYLLILPWNLADEIMDVAGYVREWGCKFVRCIPKLEVTE